MDVAYRTCPRCRREDTVVAAVGASPRHPKRHTAIHECLLCGWFLDEILPAAYEPIEPLEWAGA